MLGHTTDHATQRVFVAVVLEVTDVTVAVVVVSVVVDFSLMGITADASLIVLTTASLSWSKKMYRTHKVHQSVGHSFPPNVMLSNWQVAELSLW
jgi:hypothetical protein